MGLSGNCAKPIKIQQCVKLPDSKYLHINDELAGCFGTEDHGAGRMALILSPFGKNVWSVKVDRDAKGAFLGDGWSQVVAAHGIGVGWYLVIRHEGCGVLTLKAFDASFVIKEFGLTITVLSPAEIENAFARKPQFIVPLQRSFMEKMPVPPEFLQRGYISDEDLNRPRPIATFLTSWHIELKKDGPNVFFTGSEWPKFLAYFEIAETDVLLIKYQGCMNFSFETFRHGTNEHIEEKTSSSQQSEQSPGAQSQEEEHVSTPKRKRSKGERMLEIPITSGHLNKKTKCFSELGPAGSQASLRKKINSDSALRECHLPGHFGYKKHCKIMLKPVESSKSWEVVGAIFKRSGTSHYVNRVVKGWPKFCKENGLKKGDVCTFKVVDSTLWEVDIERC